MTEEHIFADWIGRFLKKNSLYQDSRFSESFIRTKAGTVRSLHKGNFIDRKIPVLCTNCNNEWGSNIQKKAGDALKPIVKGGWRHLTETDCARIAKFATCYAMVAEFLEPPSFRVISQQTREQFRKKSTIPDGWRIFIAPYAGEPSVFRQRKTFTQRIAVRNEPRSFAETFAIGNLSVLVFGTSDENLMNYSDSNHVISSALRRQGMIQVWPIGIPFPPSRPPSVTDANTDDLLSTVAGAITGRIWR